MPLTPEEKAANRRKRMLWKLKEVGLVKAKNKVASELQKLRRLESRDPLDGLVSCVTCNWRGDYRDCHGGHYIPRRHNATLFLWFNIHPQCPHCNKELSGNVAEYRKYLVVTYGLHVVEILETMKNWNVDWNREQLVNLQIAIRERIKALSDGSD